MGSFLVRSGWVGVDIFFVISGFVLFLPFLQSHMEKEKYPIKRYFKKRFSRILPAYYFMLLLLVTFFYPGFIFDKTTILHVLGHATFTEGFIMNPLKINGVFWTLWIEMQFYLILPLFSLLFLGKRWWISAIGVFLFVIIYKWSGITLTEGLSDTHKLKQFWISFQLPGVLQEFTIGIIAASIYMRVKNTEWWTTNRLLLSLLVPVGFAIIISGMGFITNYGPTKYWFGNGALGYYPLINLNNWLSIGAGLVILGICSQERWIRIVFANKVITFIGMVSYGVYLWHYPIGNYLKGNIPYEGITKYILLILVGSIFTVTWAYLSYRFIEKPFLIKKIGG